MTRKLTLMMMTLATMMAWQLLAFNNPEVRELDIDVDSDYDCAITDADDSIETSKGGIVFVGGWTNITIKQTVSTAQDGDPNTVRLSWIKEHIELAETSGGAAITPDGFMDAAQTTAYKDYPGLDTTMTLWVHGISDSDTLRDVAIRLELQHYDEAYDPNSHDEIAMTVIKKLDLEGYDACRAVVGDAVAEDEEETPGVLTTPNNDTSPDPLEAKLVVKPIGVDGLTGEIDFGGNWQLYSCNSGNGVTWTVHVFQFSLPKDNDYVVGEITPKATWTDQSKKVTATLNIAGASKIGEDKVVFGILKVELITPDGDPVNAAVQSGDGQNEFSYDVSPNGVLTMNLKAKVSPSGLADQIKDQCVFTVYDIEGSTRAWATANPGGKPTASGDYLEATVTFTGLPEKNSSFGSKRAAIYHDAIKMDENPYEVFYKKNADNHPGGQSGSPNWFYYWGQAIGAIGIKYVAGGGGWGECPAMLRWDYLRALDKEQIIIKDDAAAYDAGEVNADHGQKDTSGIDVFVDTYVHESKHRDQIKQADSVVGIVPNTPWRYGWSWGVALHNHWSLGRDGKPGLASTGASPDPGDDDNNGVIDDFIVTGRGELGSGDDDTLDSGDDWPLAWGQKPSMPWCDNHPIEDQAYNAEPDDENARASLDWGDPGKNHKTLNVWYD